MSKKKKKERVYALDIEVGPGYFLVGIMDVNSGKVWQFDHTASPSKVKKRIDKADYIVTFNGVRYDSPVLGAWLDGGNPYEASKSIIDDDGNWWDFPEGIPKRKHIDLMAVSPAVEGGLKLQGGRIFAKNLQDIPVDPHAEIDRDQFLALAEYNVNDLDLTKQLYDYLKPQIELRKSMGWEALSKSDAQMAGFYILKDLGLSRKDVGKIEIPKSVTYKPPKYLKFKSPHLKELLEKLDGLEIKVNQGSGQPIMPEFLKDRMIVVGDTAYKMGMGGLHAHVKQLVVEGDIEDADAAALYPSLILANGWYPMALGKAWLEKYRHYYDMRMKAKEVLKNG